MRQVRGFLVLVAEKLDLSKKNHRNGKSSFDDLRFIDTHMQAGIRMNPE